MIGFLTCEVKSFFRLILWLVALHIVFYVLSLIHQSLDIINPTVSVIIIILNLIYSMIKFFYVVWKIFRNKDYVYQCQDSNIRLLGWVGSNTLFS